MLFHPGAFILLLLWSLNCTFVIRDTLDMCPCQLPKWLVFAWLWKSNHPLSGQAAYVFINVLWKSVLPGLINHVCMLRFQDHGSCTLLHCLGVTLLLIIVFEQPACSSRSASVYSLACFIWWAPGWDSLNAQIKYFERSAAVLSLQIKQSISADLLKSHLL